MSIDEVAIVITRGGLLYMFTWLKVGSTYFFCKSWNVLYGAITCNLSKVIMANLM